ncbi:MAG TPA: ribonuclease P protein component [Candidatus Saccharimonadales bacterium]|nr:ribonuclease P protein component [Candidatus Saccharimonadales bacterium]
MIQQIHRFHGRSSLRYVYQRGRVIRASQWQLRIALNPNNRTYRLAVVVSRKVSKSAVVRNRIRRRLYEAVRCHEALITQPFDLVLVVRDEQLAIMNGQQLIEDVKVILESAGVLDKGPARASDVHAIVKAKENN